ncbi:DnaD domain-containing protein [Paenibacillus sp.]|uniref:DnaD domain-containing protein n=1 Tax=Paenibacillus sp. TaxID=58172 RepID=UPI002D57847C|nr:DnaD domain protein [Paenibacillus sp.]HZG55080.1 DnaD domain protein [Paenibacillus sp.]
MSDTKSYRAGLRTGLRLGSVAVPGLLLRTYAKLGLSEIEAMLLVHLMYFAEREYTLFPTPDQLAARMSTTPDRVLAAIERFVREGFVTIEDDNDAATGVRGERYDLTPLFDKLAAAWEDGASDETFADDDDASDGYSYAAEPSETRRQTAATAANAPGRETAASRRKDLFTVFESEFARPLSPMEYETIVGWLDQDRYSDSLIMTALKEAVFAGKVHFRYIDRILMEWQRNRITTPEEAKAYTERFRGGR